MFESAANTPVRPRGSAPIDGATPCSQFAHQKAAIPWSAPMVSTTYTNRRHRAPHAGQAISASLWGAHQALSNACIHVSYRLMSATCHRRPPRFCHRFSTSLPSRTTIIGAWIRHPISQVLNVHSFVHKGFYQLFLTLEGAPAQRDTLIRRRTSTHPSSRLIDSHRQVVDLGCQTSKPSLVQFPWSSPALHDRHRR